MKNFWLARRKSREKREQEARAIADIAKSFVKRKLWLDRLKSRIKSAKS